MAKKKSGLGRGLDDIFDDTQGTFDNLYNDKKLIEQIDVDSIKPNPHQPRKSFNEEKIDELAKSIESNGLLQPIIITHDIENGGYYIIAGERRYRAVKKLGKSYVDCIIVDAEKHNMRALALIENIQREDLNPIEIATCYKELISEHNLTHEELSERINKSRSSISNTLRILELSDRAKNLLISGELSMGHAKVLVGLSPNEENIMIDSILGQKLSVRDTEQVVKKRRGRVPDEWESLLVDLKNKIQDSNNQDIAVRIKHKSITLVFKDEKDIKDFYSRLR